MEMAVKIASSLSTNSPISFFLRLPTNLVHGRSPIHAKGAGRGRRYRVSRTEDGVLYKQKPGEVGTNALEMELDP